MIFRTALKLTEESISFVVITITETKGSAPQDPGAKCIVSKNGLETGTIGGGKVEAAAIGRAKEILLSEKKIAPITLKWNLQKDIKMTCGGEVTFLFEHFPASSWKIALFGAGHVGQALSRILSRLPCQLTVIDERDEWLSKIEHKNIKCLEKPREFVKSCDKNTYFICMTKGHASDVPILHEIFLNFPNAIYVGVIGSKSKSNAIRKDLLELGVSKEFISKIKIPIGLPIGTNHPEEIAISISAELLQRRVI